MPPPSCQSVQNSLANSQIVPSPRHNIDEVFQLVFRANVHPRKRQPGRVRIHRSMHPRGTGAKARRRNSLADLTIVAAPSVSKVIALDAKFGFDRALAAEQLAVDLSPSHTGEIDVIDAVSATRPAAPCQVVHVFPTKELFARIVPPFGPGREVYPVTQHSRGEINRGGKLMSPQRAMRGSFQRKVTVVKSDGGAQRIGVRRAQKTVKRDHLCVFREPFQLFDKPLRRNRPRTAAN